MVAIPAAPSAYPAAPCLPRAANSPDTSRAALLCRGRCGSDADLGGSAGGSSSEPSISGADSRGWTEGAADSIGERNGREGQETKQILIQGQITKFNRNRANELS